MRSRIGAIGGSLVILFALAACSASGVAAPTIEGAWARPGIAGAETAAYLTIAGTAGQADALLSASSPSAEKVELHEATMDASGTMAMHPIDHLDIHAGETVELKPGGFHIMVMGLTKDLAVGDKLELELTFEHAGKVVVQAEVRQG